MKRGHKFRWLFAALLLAGLLTSWWWLHEPRYQGRTVSAWLQDLDSKSPEIVEKAESALKTMGTNALPTMVAFLYAKEPPWKTSLTGWMKQQSWMPYQFVPAETRRLQAREAFSLLRETAAPVVPQIIPLMAEDGLWGLYAQEIVRWIGPAAVDPLLSALANGRHKRDVANILSSYPDEKNKIIPYLLPLLKDPDAEVRRTALKSVLWLEEEPALLVPLLLAALKDREPEVRAFAAEFLRPPQALFPNEKTTRFGVTGIRCPAAIAVPALLECLNGASTPTVTVRVADALSRYGSEAAPAVPDLVKLAANTTPARDSLSRLVGDRWRDLVQSSSVRSTNNFQLMIADAAKSALKRVDPQVGVRLLLDDLSQGNVPQKIKAIDALSEMPAPAEQVVPGLVLSLQDESVEVKALSIYALKGFGPKARTAVPRLKTLRADTTQVSTLFVPPVGRHDDSIDPRLLFRAVGPRPTWVTIGALAKEALWEIGPAVESPSK